MKLKELLEVIPDNYEIGLANFDKDNGIIVYGTKADAIQKFAEKEKFIKEQVEGMNVIAIHPIAFHIPTKYLNIDVAYHTVKIKLDYKGLKVLFPVYGEEE